MASARAEQTVVLDTAAQSALTGVCVLIPARRLEPGLLPMIDALLKRGFGAVVVVNDGMTREDRQKLESGASLPRVHVLNHAVNLGKGRALKTGMNYVLSKLPGFAAVVTADADGQHAIEDIVRVASATLKRGAAAVLGCRQFGRDVPLRSRFGNSVTRLVFSYFSGHDVSDTQTGLRGFPAALLPELMTLQGERYEYEMTVLAYLSRRGVELVEVPIETIYIDENHSSHFNPVRDSMRVYFVLLRFYASSLISAVLDLVFFTIMFWMTRNLLASIVVGRVSSLVNFALNRTLVFHSKSSISGTLGRYYALAVVLAAASYEAMRVFSMGLGWNVVMTKVGVETTLSLLSFAVQRTFVFTSATPEG